MFKPARSLATLALTLLAAGPALAIGITDARGDYMPGYAGSKLGDLDVIGAFATYNLADDSFVFSGTMDANVGSSSGGFYVWGINRGNNAAGFAANGLPNVLFDTVLIVRQDGSATLNRLSGAGAGATQLAAGTAKVVGSTIAISVPGALLPSNGLGHADYTWNLWPRDGTLPGGFGQISDFAPDTSNFGMTVIGSVPEPASGLLLALGAATLALRRRRAAQDTQFAG